MDKNKLKKIVNISGEFENMLNKPVHSHKVEKLSIEELFDLEDESKAGDNSCDIYYPSEWSECELYEAYQKYGKKTRGRKMQAVPAIAGFVGAVINTEPTNIIIQGNHFDVLHSVTTTFTELGACPGSGVSENEVDFPVSATEIHVAVPSPVSNLGAGTNIGVVVTDSNNKSTSQFQLAVVAGFPSDFTTISSVSGTITNNTPNSNLTITGTNFKANGTVLCSVFFDFNQKTVKVDSVVPNSDTEIVVEIPSVVYNSTAGTNVTVSVSNNVSVSPPSSALIVNA